MAGATGTRAVAFLHGAVDWAAGSTVTNPTNGLTIVDTGALASGNYLFAVVGSCDASWTYEVRHLDSGLSTVHFVRRQPAAGNDDLLFPNKVTLAESERIRVVATANATAVVQLSIFWMEVA